MKIPHLIVFNFITNYSLEALEMFPYFNKRLKSMCLDLGYILAIFFPWIIIISLPFFIFHGNIKELNVFISFVQSVLIVFTILNKDLCNGRSIAKRLLGYVIIDAKTNKIASDYKCMLRNITIIIFPLEVFVTFLNNKRRIGDLIAGTKLVECDVEAKETFLFDLMHKKKFSSKLIIVSLVITLFINLLMYFGF
jgi:uncharacterized RDD family membrane protein YckC